MAISTFNNTVDGKELVANVTYDEYAESPRSDDFDCNVALFFFKTRDGINLNELNIDINGGINSWKEVERLIKAEYGTDIAIIKPVFKYEHSGISLSYAKSCPFDSGQIGFSVLLKSKIREIHNIKKVTKKYLEQEIKCMDNELETYSNWLNGDTYRVVVEDEEGDLVNECGFYTLENAECFAKECLGLNTKQ